MLGLHTEVALVREGLSGSHAGLLGPKGPCDSFKDYHAQVRPCHASDFA